jgi:hypothetical protein
VIDAWIGQAVRLWVVFSGFRSEGMLMGIGTLGKGVQVWDSSGESMLCFWVLQGNSMMVGERQVMQSTIQIGRNGCSWSDSRDQVIRHHSLAVLT